MDTCPDLAGPAEAGRETQACNVILYIQYTGFGEIHECTYSGFGVNLDRSPLPRKQLKYFPESCQSATAPSKKRVKSDVPLFQFRRTGSLWRRSLSSLASTRMPA
jgi:hypothetical protein